jgi:hypothetical protein
LAVLLLIHTPPGVMLASVVCDPSHTCSVPVIGAGSGFTVSARTVKHPVPTAYVITDVPADIPAATPVVASIVALDVLLLLHVPPGTVLVKVVVLPTHTCATPLIAGGRVTTVTALIALQPVPSVYVTGITPAVIPLTTPVTALIVP